MNLREAAGVPEGIYEAANKIYNRILSWVDKSPKKKNTTEIDFTFRGDFRISDLNFSSVKVKIGLERFKKIDTPQVVTMINKSESKKTPDFKLEPIKLKTFDLVIVLGLPEDWDLKNLKSFFEQNKKDIVESITHELKHYYDHHKIEYDEPRSRALYQASLKSISGFRPIDFFFHNLYFSSANENLVRPSELIAAIKNNEISQKDFLEFLKNHEVYKRYKEIANFNLEEFNREILSDKKLNKFLKKAGFNPDQMSDKKKIKKIHDIIYKVLSNLQIQEFQSMITHSFVEKLLGFEGEKQKVFEKFISRTKRFKKPEDFMKYYEKYFQYIGDRMLRKISKVYSLI